ncbi:hypothetical protein [Chryseobacterium sp. NKUCC03_KSP]|uniref:hypothetical protein n=1 Tax=Chryseobacterium sp. NKUCC03_KSP TaxID=2842125 RepID=UPI001C5BA6C3|nr:hypothetical protein [Chryseobacterium sp. NKUCC03_KSP]MBW3523458.1 hypothetical protein [Chryseobacterium sp. NKUCC03_KSP]
MKKIATIFVIVISLIQVYGQSPEYIQNIVPQTPEANAILKSFETPVSLYTGSPDISVPIYSIKEGDINFDLKLSYNSTGISVGERASWVGLGWNLSIPTLVRNVRQLPDDYPNGFFYETKYPVDKVYDLTSVLSPDTPFDQMGQICPVCDEIILLYKTKVLDLESDDYRITLPDGKSISFMVNQERDAQHPVGHMVQFPDSDYRIEYITTSGNWEITNPQGYKYLYTAGNKVILQHMYCIGGGSIGDEKPVKNQAYNNTWVLSKITSPSNHILNFEYDPVLYEDCELINQTKTAFYDETAFSDGRNTVYTNYSKTKGTNFYISRIWGDFGEVFFSKDERLDYTTYGRKLNTIEIRNKAGLVNKIAFDFDYMTSTASGSKYTCNRFENDNDISKRLMLKKVRFNVNDPKPISYQFNYNSMALPNRLSYARDWWGYYNGQDNNLGLTPSIEVVMVEENNRDVKPSFTKAGILEEIIYPTGGKTKFLFESNRGISYYSDGSAKKIQDAIPVKVKGHHFSTNQDTTPGLNKVYQFPITSSLNEITNKPIQTIQITTNLNQCIYPENSIPFSNSCSVYYTVLDNNNEIVIPKSLVRDNFSRVMEIPGDKLINGLMLKVELYRGKTLPTAQFFDFNQHEATIDFVHKVIDTTLAKRTPLGAEVPLGGLRIKRIENYENIINPVIKEYDYKYDGLETGLSLFELDFFQTIPGKLFVTSQSNFPMQTGNGSIISYTHATEYRINPITNERNTTSHDFDNRYLWGSFSGSCLFNAGTGGGLQSGSVPCYESPLNGKIRSIDYSGKKIENYDYQNFVMESGKNLNKVSGMDYDRVIKTKDFAYVNVKAGINAMYLGAEFFYYNFKNFDDPDYLTLKVVKENLNGQEIITKSEYNSLSPNHHQVTKKTITSTDGTVNETSYAYAHEKSNTKLINANMIGIPLETSVVKKKNNPDPGKLLSKIETKYDNPSNLFPSSIISTDFKNIESTELTYDKYDSKGNIQQYTAKDGIVTSIIWGYNSTQPIAKITGVPYSVASSLAAEIVAASDVDISSSTEQTLIDKLDIFRKNSALQNAQITTYTYDPLIGVTSITPPSGIREIYKYDSANRLENIKDINGKLLKEFKYNYKH